MSFTMPAQNTSNITEGTNLYFTNARADARIAAASTSDLSEGSNLYFTNARARSAISATGSLSYNSTTGVFSFTERTDAEVRGLVSASGNLSYNSSTGAFSYTTPTTIASLSNHDTADLAEGTNLYFTNARADARIAAASTSDLSEGSNLYFTNARARSAISATGSLSYNSTTGVFSYTTPTTIASLSNHDTADLAEGTNLYFTNARARSAISATGSLSYNSTTGVFSYTTPTTIASLSNHDTADLAEGTNLYFTNARADARIAAASTSDLSEGTNLYFTNARADARIAAASTSDLSEGTNLYYTDARADARVALIVDSAPGTLNTLNELAAALGDDANFSTTVTNSIATKLPLAGGTITSGTSVGLTINHDTFGAGLRIHRNHASNAPSIQFLNNSGRQGTLLAIDSDDSLYWQSGTTTTNNKIFHDAYHPNADTWTTARNLVVTLTGAVTGTATQSVNGSAGKTWTIATTATSDPTLTLTGDVTGSATFTNLGNATLTATVANNSHTHNNLTNYVLKAGDTMTGKLTLNDAGYSLGDEYHKWKRSYSVTSSSPQEILYSDGNSLPTGGVYRFTAHIPGTGTDQFATAVYWNQNGTWRINVTGQSGTSSNHPEFIIDGTTNKPTIHIDHTSSYGIHILGERIELGEGTGTDNAGYAFGTDAFLGSVNNNLYFLPGGSTATGQNSYDDGNVVWHTGNLTTTNKANYDTAYTYSQVGHLPLAGGTLTGNITAPAFVQSGNSGNSFYGASFTRSASGTTTPDIWGANGTLVLGTSSSVESVGFSGANAQFYGNITVTGTVDGVDIAARNGVLTSTTTTANAALPKAGGTLTGTLTTAGNIVVPGSTGLSTSGTSTKFTTAHGYIELGPMNTSWAHIYTDRPAFYTNKEIYVINQRVFHTGYHPNADKWTTARTITLGGDLTGNVSIDGSANVTLTATVADDSHNHVISNVDGLQTALDAKPDILASGYNGTYNIPIHTGGDLYTSPTAGGVTITGSSGQISTPSHGNSSQWNTAYGWGNHASAGYITGNQTITLSGDVSGSGTTSINVTVADDSHNHVLANVDRVALTSSQNLNDYNTQSIISWGSSQPTNSPGDYSTGFVLQDNNQPQQLVQTYGGAANKVKLYGRRKTSGTWDSTWTQYFSDHYHPNADKWTTARNLVVTLTGAVTGTATQSVDGTANKTWTIATTATADPTLTLSGDVTGSATFTNLGNATLTATVANDSHTHSIYLPKAGGTMTGTLSIVTGDTSESIINLYGGSQGTGKLYVGQSTTHGGGIEYNGDGTPTSSGSGADYITLYRRTAGADSWTARNFHNSNDWKFRGNIYANDTQRVFADNYHPNADKWTTARTLTLSGDVTGSVSFDGSANASMTATVANNSHTHNNLSNYYLATNPNGYTSNVGDITGVTAGTGLTGGGTSGAVTLNVIGGSGITANANDIAVDSTVIRTTGNQSMSGVKTFTGNTAWSNGNSFYVAGAGGGRVSLPAGASYFTASNAHTGAVKIKLPTASKGQSDMISFEVTIFDYALNESLKLLINAYQYSTANWNNQSVVTLASQTGKDYTVRFGSDATSHCLWIGETTSTWSYPQVSVSNFMCGFSANAAQYVDGWGVSFVTAFDTVQDTVTSSLPMAQYAQDADKLDGQQGSYYYAASNPNGYTSNVGDITGVTAGTGLTGGGTSGAVTLNVIGGTGITANANDIAVDSTVLTTSTYGTTLTPVYAPVKKGAATLTNSYQTVCTVNGSSLGSSVRMTIAGTGPSTVISTILDIVCNHYLDILVTSQTSSYTTLTVKIVSDNNEDFAVQLKTNSANNLPVSMEVFALNSETVAFTSTNPYSGATLEHECKNGGFASSSTGGAAHEFYSNGTKLIAANDNQSLHDTDALSISGSTITLRKGDNTTETIAIPAQGDITGVTAGTGLTGGGTSGAVTLNVIGGSGITANANDIAVDSTVLRTTGGTMTGTITGRDFKPQAGYHLQRSDHHSGHLEGSYNNVGANGPKSNPIYTIGSSYNPSDAAFGNMYGIGYCSTAHTGINFTGQSNWGMYVAADGDARVWLDGTAGVVTSTGEHYVGSSRVFHDTYHPNADTLTTARTIGGVSFNGSANINLPGVNTAGNQNTSGNAATATSIYTTQTAGTAGVHYPTFVSANVSGNKSLKYDPGMMYDPSTNTLGDVNFKFQGTLTGNATTATNLTSGSKTITGDLTVSGNQVITAGTSARVKFSVWSGTTYGIGMGSGYTFGAINNEYVMSFQMNDASDRGFWWGDASHTNAQGAMALSTDGYLTVARGMRIGFGESDTAHPLAGIQCNGTLDIRDAVGTGSSSIHVPRGGYITLYGNGNDNHSICSRNSAGNAADSLRINSYAAVFINLDSNSNNASGADFKIGRHGSGSGAMSLLLSVSGENGDLISGGNITAYGSASDIRLKDNVQRIADPIEKVKQLDGVTFTYKKDGSESTGLIAQQLLGVLPQVVYETKDLNDDETHYAVRYGQVAGLLVEAIKDQQKEIDELKSLVKQLITN